MHTMDIVTDSLKNDNSKKGSPSLVHWTQTQKQVYIMAK